MRRKCLQYVTWGGGQFTSKLSNKITFFSCGKKNRVGVFYSFYNVMNIDILDCMC